MLGRTANLLLSWPCISGPPGYGEMFSALGFDDLVQKARTGTTRRELAAAIPVELLDRVSALGSRDRVAERLGAYREAGADCVAVVPSTAEDPGGRATLSALNSIQEGEL